MRIRVKLTVDVSAWKRAIKATQDDTEAPPVVDHKGPYILERSEQDQPNDVRAKTTHPTWRER